jgi:integrase
MGTKTGKLTALTVAAVAKGKTRRYYSDGAGLYLQVSPGGASWVFRYRVDGRLREMGLGSFGAIGLADARQRAQECWRQRLDGKDPIEARRAERMKAKIEAARSMTFRQCADAYFEAHRASWRSSKHAVQWRSSLATHAARVFGDLPVADVDLALVLKVIEPLWSTKPETANRVRGRIEAVLDWAKVRGYRTSDNPARWRGHLESLLPARSKIRRIEHHPALPYPEIGSFMVELRRQEGVAARALEFTILTAGRSGEVNDARWNEIDIAERLWAIPAERMKGRKEHRVPLSDAVLTILEMMRAIRTGDFIFPGRKTGRPIAGIAMWTLLKRMGRGALTVHGFRSTFRDWCAERTTFPAEVAEMALAHTVGDRVEAAYRRGDLFQKRRQLLDAWAKFCTTSPAAGQVVPIRQPAAPK